MTSSTSILPSLSPAGILRYYGVRVLDASPTHPARLELEVTSLQSEHLYGWLGQDWIFRTAAKLAKDIILSAAFEEGNEKFAILAADLFLKINGFKFRGNQSTENIADDPVLIHAQTALRENRWSIETIAECFQSIAEPLDQGLVDINYAIHIRVVPDSE
ncbi:DOC family protein [Nemania sp. FL0916]|nr:DOC family protein [Nemania sp. FL0916]